MKKKWLFLMVVAIVISLTLIPLSFLNAVPASGTTLSVTKDADGRSEGYITWSIEKSVDQASFYLVIGETTTAHYTVTVTPAYNETGRSVRGNIHIENTGGEEAIIDYVNDMVEYQVDGGPWIVLTTETVSGPFTIPAGSSSDVSYSVSFTPVAGATAYRNTALVGLANYSMPGGGVGFHEFSYTVDFSVSGGTAHNPFANVSDSLVGPLGVTWVGNSSTYTYTYDYLIGPYLAFGDYTVDNTATVTGIELPTSDSDSLSITVHVIPTKAGKLEDSGIPGKGLDTAPGQQKPFNPKSQASEHAGMKE